MSLASVDFIQEVVINPDNDDSDMDFMMVEFPSIRWADSNPVAEEISDLEQNPDPVPVAENLRVKYGISRKVFGACAFSFLIIHAITWIVILYHNMK